MAFHYSPKIVTDGLVFYVDSANNKSYQIGTGIEYDLVGQQDMILNNGVTYSTDNLGCLVFDGINQFCESTSIYNTSESMTWDVWFNRSESVNDYNMILSHYSPYLSFRDVVGSNKFIISFYTRLSGVNTQRTMVSNQSFLDNTWYNVSFTRQINVSNGSYDLKMYVNGELEVTKSEVGVLDTMYQANDELRIADHSSIGQRYPFKGKIPSLKIYNKILSEDEIRQNYIALKSRFGL